jgi:hypothetical protein
MPRPSQESLAGSVAGGAARSISAHSLTYGRKRHNKRRISPRVMRGILALLTIIAVVVMVLLVLRF